MKKSLFFLASLAVFAMMSCNSSDESVEMMNGGEEILTKAGGLTQIVTSEVALKRALNEKKADITIGASFTIASNIELNYPVTINGATGKILSTTASIICKASTNFNNLTIDATTPLGQGVINLESQDITVSLENVNITQHTAGTADNADLEGLAINNVSCKNTLKLDNTTIVLPSDKYVRAINMYSTEKDAWVNLEIKNSHITCGNDLSFPSTYSRIIQLGSVNCSNLVIDNSTLEGAYYVVNVTGSSKVTANVTNGSVLDGRAAFNIWASDFAATVNNSTLVGRNNYTGPTEEFANIVINQGAKNSTLNLTDVTFKMEVSNNNGTNQQYAVSYRESNQTLVLAGIMKVFDTKANEVSSYFAANMGVTDLNIVEEPGFKLEHKWVDTSEINN